MELSREQYKEALLSDGTLKERSVELLSLLYNAPNCEATGSQPAEAFGYKDFRPINALIGKLGKRIAEYHSVSADDLNDGFQGVWWQLIMDGRRNEQGFNWSLKGNLFDALVELELLQELEVGVFPEVVSPTEDLYEGARKTIIVNSYERNASAAKMCKNHYGTICLVCDMDFESVYGDLGKGFIHVHHLIELSTIAKKYKVNPIRDLRPVCPNCHAMLHRTKPALSIDQLRSVMEKKNVA